VANKTLREAIAERLPDARILAFDFEQPQSGDGQQSNTRRHQLLMTGEWKGHWQGAFTVTESDLQRIVNNAKAQDVDILVDYEHASVFSLFGGGDTRAAGWLDPQSLSIEEDAEAGHALYGTIAWTDAAAASIRAKEFKYKSPTIQWRTKDRKTNVDLGTSLHSVALTNTPFLEELPEVTLNSLAARITGPDASTQETEDMDPKQVAAIALSLGLKAEASADDIQSAAQTAANDARALERICSAAGIEPGSGNDEIVNAVTSLKAQSISPDELKALRAQAASGHKVEVEAAVEKAAREGKVAAANKAWAVEYATKDLGAFNKWAETALVGVPVKPKTAGKDAPTGLASIDPKALSEDDTKAIINAMSDAHKEIASQFGLSLESYVSGNAADLLAEING
jgi:phage I-like protein